MSVPLTMCGHLHELRGTQCLTGRSNMILNHFAPSIETLRDESGHGRNYAR